MRAWLLCDGNETTGVASASGLVSSSRVLVAQRIADVDGV
jgi:hypothetical protein